MTKAKKKICTQIWGEYEGDLYRLCGIMLRSRKEEVTSEDIEEILSEVFVLLCKKVMADGAPEHTKAWLYSKLYLVLSRAYERINWLL